jgi:hypothetical protein
MATEGLSSKGVAMYLSKGDAVPTDVAATAITKAKPAEVTATLTAPAPPAPPAMRDSGGIDAERTPVAQAASEATAPPVAAPHAITAFTVGQIVIPRDTGFKELDDRIFSIAEVTANGFSLLGSNTTNSTATMLVGATMEVYDSADLIKMCLNNFAFNLETPGSINVGTYCNPSGSIPSSPTSVGTATLGGWIDVEDEAYEELLLAEEDGLKRVFSILLPLDQGEIVAVLTITGVTWDIPLEGGMAFTATGDLQTKPRHLF